MDFDKIMSGIGIVIDDALNPITADKNDLIFKIVKQITTKSIPVCEYYELPNDKELSNFRDVCFILLDWDLSGRSIKDISDGVSVGEFLKDENINENIGFLKKIKSNCFVPVFIFTALNPENIINRLKENDLFNEDRPNFIFVKQKNELTGKDQLFSVIKEWLENNPSIYALKEWESTFYKAKNQLFWSFYEINPEWPKVLWKAYKEDDINMSTELGELISRNLQARMFPFEFSEDILGNADLSKMPKNDIRKVLEGERFIKNKNYHPNDIYTGDLFREEYQNGADTRYRYYLNIRPQCDIIRETNPELYCLKGRIVDEVKIKDELTFENGQFLEKLNNAIVLGIDNGKIIEFLFRDIKTKKYSTLKNKRIGRLIPPYITRIQQRYALYLQRQGLPRTPKEAVFDNNGG